MISGFKVEYLVNGREDGEATLQRMALAFERAGDELDDFGRYLFPRLIPVFESELEAQFAAQGRGPNAGSWAPLSEQYAAWKEQHFPGQPILQRSGELFHGLTSSSSPFAKRITEGNEFDFGTVGVEYASFHQLGTEHMPARPEFDFGGEMERLLQREGAAAAQEAIAASGADEFLTAETS